MNKILNLNFALILLNIYSFTIEIRNYLVYDNNLFYLQLAYFHLIGIIVLSITTWFIMKVKKIKTKAVTLK